MHRGLGHNAASEGEELAPDLVQGMGLCLVHLAHVVYLSEAAEQHLLH